MMPNLTRVLSDSLILPDEALVWEISRRLADLFPGQYILETQEYDFDLEEYARSGRCSIHPLDDAHTQLDAYWDGEEEGAVLNIRNAFLEIQWRGRRLHALIATYNDGCETKRTYLIADDVATARAFFEAVCDHSAVVEGQILVYRDGGWRKDAALMRQIEAVSFDDLVVPDGVRRALEEDVVDFFASGETYDAVGVAWKRGVLLLGPPGNGKTHAIKGLIRRLGVPALYVRSFHAYYTLPAENIERVFKKARAAAPCLLVLEDLDSLVDANYLSYFLNELDGFASNRGILTIATTNHPERLDPALLERPSRFDRKITFALPALAERRRFLASLDARRDPGMRLSDEDLDKVAKKTEGFSFAYLKELHLSATMAWMRGRETGGMGRVTRDLIKPLRAQMSTESRKSAEEG